MRFQQRLCFCQRLARGDIGGGIGLRLSQIRQHRHTVLRLQHRAGGKRALEQRDRTGIVAKSVQPLRQAALCEGVLAGRLCKQGAEQLQRRFAGPGRIV